MHSLASILDQCFAHLPLASLLLRCAGCEEPLDDPTSPACEACRIGLIPAPPLCSICWAPGCFSGDSAKGAVCLQPELGFTSKALIRGVSARFQWSGSGYTLFKRWKTTAGSALNTLLLPRLSSDEALLGEWDAIVPVPQDLRRSYGLHGSPALRIAQWLANTTRVPVRANALQWYSGTSQRARGELNLAGRLASRSRFTQGRISNPPLRVVLVDDVLTSGKTFREAVTALANGGTEEIYLFALGVRPKRMSLNRGFTLESPTLVARGTHLSGQSDARLQA